MNKKNKGFTLVELLVVIAILAILAAVSVVGYLGFTEKANLSNDQTMIKMINDNLMAEFVDDKPKSASEAMRGLENLNITKEKLVAYSNDYHYAYDLDNNQMLLLDSNNAVVYPKGMSMHDNVYGLYMGNLTDDVGTKKYVALTNVNDFMALESVASQNITIDLNNFYFSIEQLEADVQIDLINGSYIESESTKDKINYDESVKTMADAIKPDNSNTTYITLDKNIYENVIFDGLTSGFTIRVRDNQVTTFNNCLFIGGRTIEKLGNLAITYTNGLSEELIKNTEIILNKCTITNSTWLQTDISNVTIKDSSFINCSGGFNLQRPTIKAIIDNNTFDMLADHKDNKATAIMLSPESIFDKDNNYVHQSYADGYHIDFKNNNILNSRSIVRIHRGSYIDYQTPGNSLNNYKTIKPEQIEFENNKIGNLTGDFVEDWQALPTSNEELKQIMKDIADKIK